MALLIILKKIRDKKDNEELQRSEIFIEKIINILNKAP